ncbi:hypothetical protein [Singulisphaera sp. PoT]|uniref:hypothetical protein n=1 Tax=Singulisphaera sp. PoT TaxID=3411797 RepID=UPI003BF5062B
MSPDDERPLRLRLADQEQRQAAVLADLTTRGPSRMSDLELRLGSLMNTKLLRLTLTELEAAGRITCEVRTFNKVDQKAKAWDTGSKAKVYSLVTRES